jgi:hypothetical protein
MKQANKSFLAQLDLNLVTKKNVIFFAVLIFLLFIKLIGFSKIANAFLYYKNGAYLDIGHYRIQFPIGHWAYFGESKITYVISGNRIGKNNLSAEFFKDAEKLNFSDAIANCDTVNKQGYSGKNIKGNIFLCTINKKEIMYFQSNYKKILIREDDYNSSNELIVNEYKLLFNSISLVPKL